MASNETSGPPPGKEREQDKKDKHTKIETNSSKTNLIPWRMPQPYCSTLETLSRTHPLVVYNSLTRSKVRFIPRMSMSNPVDRTVTWYQCGPTVYADSHIGHARTYVSLDILHRIMRDVAGYSVLVCQNVTDIDDKIILRSSEVQMPFAEFAKKYELEFNQDIYGSLGCAVPDIVTRVSDYVQEIISFIEQLVANGVAYQANGSVYFSVADFVGKGHTYGKLMPEQIGNSALLAEGEGQLAAGCEAEKRQPADFALWKKTKEGGEVVEPFWPSPWGRGRPGWHIECSAMAHSALAFTQSGDQSSAGRAPATAAGAGGGVGRGKAAAASVGQVDVHAGGVDLKFPHHENEIAQSEGFLGPGAQGGAQWVNYWLHTGHLNILGLKMSKSLKNFISIRTALQTHSSRQLRVLFLLHKYNSTMDYGDGTMTQAVNIERLFAEFFHNIKATLRRLQAQARGQDLPMGEGEQSLRSKQLCIAGQVRAALLDDFDTPSALGLLAELVRDCNKYIDTEKAATRSRPLCASSLQAVARYVTSVLRTFGLVRDGDGPDAIGFGSSSSSGEAAGTGAGAGTGSAEGAGAGSAGNNREQTLGPLLDALTVFRETVRKAAMAGDHAAVLRLTDQLRDDVLPELGVRMEDRSHGDIWKLDDPEILRKERQQREAAKEAKEKQRQEAARKQQERDERAKIPPAELFRGQGDLYSAFDGDGLPTHDSKGEPLAKAAVKKLQKELAKQKEAHDKFLLSRPAEAETKTQADKAGPAT